MTNLKKVLCLVLAMAMMLSVMIVGAGAAKTFPDQKDIVNTEAVNMAVALNIIKGRDTGNFDPTGNVNRAEMAKMICILLNGGKELVMDAKATPTFTDISGHWAEGYIEYCAALGIVAGRGDGTFDPWGNVTATEAAKMLMVTMGYDAAAEGFNGLNWSTQIDAVANEKGLYRDLPASLVTGAALSRDNAAQMVWNALQGYMVTYKSELGMVNGQLQTIKTRETETVTGTDGKSFSVTLLYKKYDKAVQEEATLDSFSYDSKKEEWTYKVSSRGDSKLEDASFTSQQDFTYLYKQNVKLVFNYKNNSNTKVDTFYGMFADDSVVLAEGIVGDLDTVNSDEKKVDLAGTEYKTDDTLRNIEVFNFGSTKANDGKLSDIIKTQYEKPASAVKLVDVDGDNKVDLVVVTPTEVKKVTSVSNTQISAGTSYKFEDANIYDGVAKDDFAVIVKADYTAKDEDTITKAESVTGTVDGIKDGSIDKGEQQVSVDGKWYTLSGDASLPEAGDTVKLAVVGDFAFDVDTTVGSAKDILFISDNYEADKDLGTDYTVEARAYFPDGTNTKIKIDKLSMVTDSKDNSPQDITGNSKEGKAGNIVDDGDLENKLFSYSKDKSGNYELKILSDFNKAGTDMFVADTTDEAKEYNKTKNTIGGKTIADDAVIFVKADDEIKVQSGKTVKDWNTDSTVKVMGALVDEVGNMNRITYAALVVDGKLPKAHGDELFGYMLSDSYKGTLDGDSVTVYKLWNGTENVTLYEDNTSDPKKAKKGTAISYREDGDYITDVETLDTYAITGFDGKSEGDIELVKGGGKSKDSVGYTLDKDCVIIGMIDKDVVGVKNANYSTVSIAAEENNEYLENAYIAFNDGEVSAIIYDDTGKLDGTGSNNDNDQEAVDNAEDSLKEFISKLDAVELKALSGDVSLLTFDAKDVTVKATWDDVKGAKNSLFKSRGLDVTYENDKATVTGTLNTNLKPQDADKEFIALEITIISKNDSKVKTTVKVEIDLVEDLTPAGE